MHLFRTFVVSTLCLCACLAATAAARCHPWGINVDWKSGTSATELGVYRMCGDSICGPPIEKFATCTEVLCPKGDRCNSCFATVGVLTADLPEFFDGTEVGRYGLQFDGETCPFLTFGSDFNGRRAWFESEGWLAGCSPRVSCRTRGGQRCRGDSPFDVAVTADGCYTRYYGRGNAESLEECIAGDIAGGVPSGEVLGVDCPDRGI